MWMHANSRGVKLCKHKPNWLIDAVHCLCVPTLSARVREQRGIWRLTSCGRATCGGCGSDVSRRQEMMRTWWSLWDKLGWLAMGNYFSQLDVRLRGEREESKRHGLVIKSNRVIIDRNRRDYPKDGVTMLDQPWHCLGTSWNFYAVINMRGNSFLHDFHCN